MVVVVVVVMVMVVVVVVMVVVTFCLVWRLLFSRSLYLSLYPLLGSTHSHNSHTHHAHLHTERKRE